MKNFVLFYDNQETGKSGVMEFSGTCYEWIFGLWDTLNPTTTLTLVEI